MRRRSLVSFVLEALGTAALMVAEARRPLRRPRERRALRAIRNLGFAVLAGLANSAVETPIVNHLARRVARRKLGLLSGLPVPAWASDVAAVLLLDASLYAWHILTHRIGPLWRFHQVHHADRDLDSSTAVRFHFGEMLASVPFRAMQVRLIGVSPRALRIWRRLLIGSIVFHHSNLRLPLPVERVLATIVMTPRLHGIHHSLRADERNWNWSSGLTIWDRLFGTLRADVPQSRIRIGLPGFQHGYAVRFGRMLILPFLKRRMSIA